MCGVIVTGIHVKDGDLAKNLQYLLTHAPWMPISKACSKTSGNEEKKRSSLVQEFDGLFLLPPPEALKMNPIRFFERKKFHKFVAYFPEIHPLANRRKKEKKLKCLASSVVVI